LTILFICAQDDAKDLACLFVIYAASEPPFSLASLAVSVRFGLVRAKLKARSSILNGAAVFLSF